MIGLEAMNITSLKSALSLVTGQLNTYKGLLASAKAQYNNCMSKLRSARETLASAESAYKTIVRMPCRVLKTSISKKYLKIKVFTYLINVYNQDIKEIKFSIDSNNYKKTTLKTYLPGTSKIKRLLDNNIYTFKFTVFRCQCFIYYVFYYFRKRYSKNK